MARKKEELTRDEQFKADLLAAISRFTAQHYHAEAAMIGVTGVLRDYGLVGLSGNLSDVFPEPGTPYLNTQGGGKIYADSHEWHPAEDGKVTGTAIFTIPEEA